MKPAYIYYYSFIHSFLLFIHFFLLPAMTDYGCQIFHDFTLSEIWLCIYTFFFSFAFVGFALFNSGPSLGFCKLCFWKRRLAFDTFIKTVITFGFSRNTRALCVSFPGKRPSLSSMFVWLKKQCVTAVLCQQGLLSWCWNWFISRCRELFPTLTQLAQWNIPVTDMENGGRVCERIKGECGR